MSSKKSLAKIISDRRGLRFAQDETTVTIHHVRKFIHQHDGLFRNLSKSDTHEIPSSINQSVSNSFSLV